MAIGNLFGSGGESNSLYGTSLTSGGSIPAASSFIYFEWFIFKVSASQPATPTGGTWDFLTNTGTPPTGWASTVSGIPLDNMWFSIAFVDSRNPTNFTWSTPGLISATTSVYASAYADKFTGNGSTTAWTLSADPVTVQNLDVSVNGVTQTPTTDYTISGTTFTTTTASPLGSIILVKYRQALPNSYYGLASNVGFTPSGWIASTNVQSALAEVATDISATDGVSGSNLVGYKPAGTGAVATTVQVKLRQTVSVFDFMTAAQIADVQAKTKTLDVTTALQTAINSITGGVVFFPAGVYKFSNLTVNQSIELRGEGWGNTSSDIFGSTQWSDMTWVHGTVLVSTATSGYALDFNSTTFVRQYRMTGIMVIGPGSGTSIGMRLGSVAIAAVECKFRDVLITNFKTSHELNNLNECDIELRSRGCYNGPIIQNSVNNCRVPGWEVQSSSGNVMTITNSNQIDFHSGLIQGSFGTSGLLISCSCDSLNFYGGWAENSASLNWLVEVGTTDTGSGNSPSATFIGWRTSQNNGFYIDRSAGTSIIGSRFLNGAVTITASATGTNLIGVNSTVTDSSATTIKISQLGGLDIGNGGLLLGTNALGKARMSYGVTTAPAAPTSGVTVFCTYNSGTGKHTYSARFPTGAVQTLATEP